MKSLHFAGILAAALAAPGLAVGGCGDVGAAGSGGGSADAGSDAPLTQVEMGELYVTRRACGDCHQEPGSTDILAGQTTPSRGTKVYGANLTPAEKTGLGDWTDEEVDRAIRVSLDWKEVPLCFQMPRFDSMSDQEVSAIIRYLRSIPPVSHAVTPSICPPVKPRPDAGVADASDDGG